MRLQFNSRLRGLKALVPAIHMRTLDKLAKLSHGQVRRLLSDPPKQPRSETAIALARVFGVSLEWLLTGEGSRGASADEVRATVNAAVSAARALRVRVARTHATETSQPRTTGKRKSKRTPEAKPAEAAA